MRQEIRDFLAVSPKEKVNYQLLKSCLVGCKNTNDLDIWVEGVIKSLFMRPNKNVLILCGKQGIGKTEFLRRLLPVKDWYSDIFYKTHIYDKLIQSYDFGSGSLKQINEYSQKDDFVIREPYTNRPRADKRLCSFVTTTNVPVSPKRKTHIELQIESINIEVFNSIDKLELWREIFFYFKID